MSRRLQWRSSRFLTMFWSWRTCLKSSFSKCKCPDGYDGDPHVFGNILVMMMNMLEIHFSKCKCPGCYNGDPHVFTNVLVMKNMLEIHFSKCECPSGYNGDPHVFCQCSGHEEHVWNPFFRMWHQILFYKTAESLEKRRQIWILWSYKNIVEEAKNVHFLK